ncbi:xanthine dehydrogenase family protein molybdopterin-binding subunit [Erythrobacter mangrovi]|uniref:Xanthine dehydrogenase family protein molybdopterin-binding subunit n=1 Tax=Erythrobacter mangrovi TaxID=2739433 RepID=A0A7D4BTI3_9SPHN|nr:xanthine dehydrogenase family protein molybdopterin-binding subunit [Erythrobacter mangrovi]QKG70647.1 xanthine dehydrogenase family protein molybdopterin-binding subunit [Erythrobacter mangrovi]
MTATSSYSGELSEPAGWVGRAIERREDDRLLKGAGRFVDDIVLPGQLHAAFVRSPHPHASFTEVDFAEALAVPGVHLCLSAKDFDQLPHVKPNWILPRSIPRGRPILAQGRVRYVGEPVAVVIAESLAAARDAAELVRVDFTPLPHVLDQRDAIVSDAPRVHDDMDSNVAATFSPGNGGFAKAADAAPFRTRFRLRNQRLVPFSIEGRAVNADYDTVTGRMTLNIAQQLPHMARRMVAETIGFPENRLRVISPDVGGGFGPKMHVYQEEAVCALASMKLGRPVKWTESRSENVCNTTHGRDHEMQVDVAYDHEGKLLALRIESLANIGAYMSSMGSGIPTVNVGLFVMGVYEIPSVEVDIKCLYTHTPPVDAYRGAGRPEASYVIERTIDRVAHELGLDPAEVRRRNFLTENQIPRRQPTGAMIDSGRYHHTLEDALRRADYDEFRQAQAKARTDGELTGIGIANYTESCGVGPGQVQKLVGFDRGGYESARVRMTSDGGAMVFSGSHSHGQGHKTVFAQIAADELGISPDRIEVIQGDTDSVPQGVGTFNSRSIPVGGSAVKVAAGRVADRIRRLAAHLLQVEVDALQREGDVFRAPDGGVIAFSEVCHAAWTGHNVPADLGVGLEETEFYHPTSMSAPYGAHIAQVRIDRETGEIALERYVAVDDCGTVINPLLARGQVHGGLAQGIGQALWEDGTPEADGGIILDTPIPRFDMLPRFETSHTVTESWTNPLGAKGLGEAGAIGAPPAIVNAAIDALWHLGVHEIDMPLTPARILAAIDAAEQESAQ